MNSTGIKTMFMRLNPALQKISAGNAKPEDEVVAFGLGLALLEQFLVDVHTIAQSQEIIAKAAFVNSHPVMVPVDSTTKESDK